MKQITKNIVWLAAFLGIGSIQALAEPFAERPYLGQTPPGPIAQVFAPGLICHTGPHQWESHGTFSADGNTFCGKKHTLPEQYESALALSDARFRDGYLQT